MQEDTHCKHYVKRKKRFCRMTVKQGHEYCGEHEPSSTETTDNATDNKNIRIVCPLDNKHTCYAHNLKKHLKICNAREVCSVPYIVKGFNKKSKNTGEQHNKRSLSDVPTTQIQELIKKINNIHDEIIKDALKENFLTYDIVEEELRKPEYGDRTRKHLIQVSSILGHLKLQNLFSENTCYIEFGAGKGQLSYWVSKSIETLNGSSVLLIERASHRHKRDNKLDKTQGKVNRIRADISDLVLDKIECLNNVKIVALTKHLCGDATDLTLRCLVNSTRCLSGLIMAFCCHHRCQWDNYTGQEFFESVQLSKLDFDVMCGLVSWATCGTGFSRERKNQAVPVKRDIEIGLNRDEREEVGRKCKNIIDWGRVSFLKKLGFECSLCYYVPTNVSLENVCVVAIKN